MAAQQPQQQAQQAQQACPRCRQADFNYEDLDEGTKLVCRECGFVLDDVVLVHHAEHEEDGSLRRGAFVSARDDGRIAGAAAAAAAGGAPRPMGLRQRPSGVLARARERLHHGLAFLQLPQHVASAAKQLLPQVVGAYAAGGLRAAGADAAGGGGAAGADAAAGGGASAGVGGRVARSGRAAAAAAAAAAAVAAAAAGARGGSGSGDDGADSDWGAAGDALGDADDDAGGCEGADADDVAADDGNGDARTAQPRMLVSPAVVAAVLYLAARQERHALSFGGAAAALSVPGPLVFQEYKRIRQALQLEVAPPSLEAAVVYAASELLPRYLPGLDSSTPLRGQPLARSALQVCRLVVDAGAAEGRSPWLAAAAILAMCLAEHFGDATPASYAREVAALLHHSPANVAGNVRTLEQRLAPLLALLPFVQDSGAGTEGIGVQVVRNAPVLLKLQHLSAGSRVGA